MPRRLTEGEVARLKALAQEYVDRGERPDFEAVSRQLGFVVSGQLYDKLCGRYRWTPEQKALLRELWIRHCDNPNIDDIAAQLRPLKLAQVKRELRFMTRNDPSLKPFG